MTEAASFFARRRAGLKAEREADAATAAPPEVVDASEAEPDLSQMSDVDILELLDLPDPDSLRKGDNFAAFMAKAVPMHLRNRALRNLWRSDPVLACLDGLNDYDTDYLTGSTGQGVIRTSYQVGRGLLAHVEKLAADAAAADDAGGADTAITAPGVREDVAAPDPAVADLPAVPDDPQTPAVHVADAAGDVVDDDRPAPAPRRMRFYFGDRA